MHGVLQVIGLADGAGLTAAAAGTGRGAANRQDVIERLAGTPLATTVAAEATAGEFWRELWVAAPIGDHLVEGYVDLLYQSQRSRRRRLEDRSGAGRRSRCGEVARYRLGAAYAAAVDRHW